MRYELVWGDGISILIDLPREMTGDAFLEVVEELELLIKRTKSNRRLDELEKEIDTLQERESGKSDTRLFREFLTWKRRQKALPPLPRPAFEEDPYTAWHPPATPKRDPVDALQERLDRLERTTARVLDTLDRTR